MRIDCPYCGSRDAREFTVHGSGELARRPDPNAPDALEKFVAYLHDRDNQAGMVRELWFHGAGCHSWLVLTRDNRTHHIEKVEAVRTLSREAEAQ